MDNLCRTSGESMPKENRLVIKRLASDVKERFHHGQKCPVVEEPKSADSSGDQVCDQTPGSLTADLVPPPFTLYVASPQPGGNTARAIGNNLPDDWKPGASMVLNHLKYYVIYVNFAQSALNKFKKDLPRRYSHLIQMSWRWSPHTPWGTPTPRQCHPWGLPTQYQPWRLSTQYHPWRLSTQSRPPTNMASAPRTFHDRCSFCNSVGHSQKNCFFFKNKKKEEMDKKEKEEKKMKKEKKEKEEKKRKEKEEKKKKMTSSGSGSNKFY
ncbi:Hypothetical protein CINCED_3A019462 [Cinara cedri]|uniref:Uncharacterized protein n=1 Tax=Cinara cedri TaxID=506608 RepID=A0A5E4MKV5_9HEMI|nr:Hypothetical protein CINCED_3A019462 [Cinara cedri]